MVESYHVEYSELSMAGVADLTAIVDHELSVQT